MDLGYPAMEKAMCYAWRSWARSHGDSNESIQHDATTSVRATFNDTPSQFMMHIFLSSHVMFARLGLTDYHFKFLITILPVQNAHLYRRFLA